MITLLNIIQGTPAWVWIVFIYLVVVGISACKTRLVSVWQLSIAPSIFMLWSIYNLTHKSDNVSLLIVYSMLFISAAFIGYKLMHNSKIQIYSGKLQLPG